MHRSIFASVALSLLAVGASAQLPEWVTLPSANVNTGTLFLEATICVAQEPNAIHVYSSFRRAWAHLTVSPSARFWGYDDHAVVQDGAMFWAYASRFHRFAPLPTVSGTLITAGAQSWVSVVVDGTTAYAFSSLLGAWIPIPFQSVPGAASSRMVAVISDGAKTVAVSAYFGSPVALPALATYTDAIGLCGLARDAQNVYAFSAYRNAWDTIPASSLATIVKPPNRASFIAVQDLALTTFWSAVTGTTAFAPTLGTLQVKDDVAVIVNGNTVHAWSGLAGVLVSRGLPSAPTVTLQRYLAIVEHGNTVDAFSAPRGAYAAPLSGSYTMSTDLSVALALDGLVPKSVYSALTNAWSAAPVVPSAHPYLTWCSVILVDPSGGMDGFSAHTGTWSHVASPPIDSAWQANAMFCARSGSRLDVYNPRRSHWATVDTGSPVAVVTPFDQSVLAQLGNDVWAYCLYSDKWSKRSFASMPIGTQVRDECVLAYDATTLHVFGGSDQISNISTYPYDWRTVAHGGPLAWHLAGEPGDASLVLINVRSIEIPLPPIGTLLVDPLGAALLALPPLPPEGMSRLGMVLPDDPTLVGVTVHAQAAMLHGSTIYLTGANEVTIL